MALSDRQKDVIRVAMANKDEGEALITELDKIAAAGGEAPLGTTADLTAAATASAAAISTSDTYTDAAVNTGIDTAVDAAVDTVLDITIGEVEARLDDIEAKVDAIIAALA